MSVANVWVRESPGLLQSTFLRYVKMCYHDWFNKELKGQYLSGRGEVGLLGRERKRRWQSRHAGNIRGTLKRSDLKYTVGVTESCGKM